MEHQLIRGEIHQHFICVLFPQDSVQALVRLFLVTLIPILKTNYGSTFSERYHVHPRHCVVKYPVPFPPYCTPALHQYKFAIEFSESSWRATTPRTRHPSCNRDMLSKFRTFSCLFSDMDNQMKRREEMIRKRRIGYYKRQLISNSTVHGLKNCFDKKSKYRRVIWTILLLIALGLLLQKLFESTVNYMSHPYTTMKTMRYENSMQFPAVSICNRNDMRRSVMKGTTLDQIIKGKNLSLQGDEYRNTIRKANHRLEDMLYSCKILGEYCSVEDFIQFNNDQGDRCFTYNHGTQGQPILFFNKTGPTYSLELTINIEAHEYYEMNDDAGISLILHGQDETPVKMPGVMLSPGFITYITVKKKKVVQRFTSIFFVCQAAVVRVSFKNTCLKVQPFLCR